MTGFFIALLFYLTGAVLAWIFSSKRNWVGSITLTAHLLAALPLAGVVVAAFRHGTVTMGYPLWTIPGIHGELFFKIDPLSALFLAIIALVAILVPLYGRGYMRMPEYDAYNLAGFYPVLSLFFAGVCCVVAVADLFFFFIFWEIMTLCSYGLVVFEKRDREKGRAGLKYFIITHIATALMFVAAMILYRESGSFSFQGQSDAMGALMASRPYLLHLVLLFFFLGFATKAGILPMGDWLPGAYAAAPTPATAAFAGSMTKLGVYGILRIFVDLLPISASTQIWGAIIAVFGTASIFIGTLTALVQDDGKKLLSFHVIGQMGYMFLSIGIGIYFLNGRPLLALAGLCAGIFHLINNVCYKSCLFFNAGSVYWKVKTFNINRVGGLARLLPITALCTLLASFAIAGLPPMNGFASKWLIYQTAIAGSNSAPLFLLLAVFALFISAVTLASFIKFSTALFYGKYADHGSGAQLGEVPPGMQLSQGLLVAACIGLGLFPLWPLQWISQAVSGLLPPALLPPASALAGEQTLHGMTLQWGAGVTAAWNPLSLLLVFILCFALVYGLYRLTKPVRRVETTWYCGEEQADEQVRYQAHSYYLAFKQLFTLQVGRYQRPGVYPTIRYPKIVFSDTGLLKKLLDLDRWFYHPLADGFQKLAFRFSATHSGIPHVYLLWLLLGAVSAVVLLFVLK